jgi:lipopolysaccharide transport system permease protein
MACSARSVALELCVKSSQSHLKLALDDALSGLLRWPLWARLGWNDILKRYRRSVLGPFWLTASTGVMVVALGLLYANLFKTPIDDFLPFLCVGFLVWNLISSFLTEGGQLFFGAESFIKQVRLPYSVYVYQAAWSKLIIFAHNVVVYFAVLAYFRIWPGAAGLLSIPGFLLVVVNSALCALAIGIVSARFRDIPQVVNSIDTFFRHSDHVEARTPRRPLGSGVKSVVSLDRNRPSSVAGNDSDCAEL